MGGRLVNGGEHSGGLHHILGSSTGPVDVGRVALAEHGDLLAVHHQESALSRNGALETTVSRVEFKQVNHVVDIDEGIVDGHHGGALIDGGAEHQAADAAKSVDSDLRHG